MIVVLQLKYIPVVYSCSPMDCRCKHSLFKSRRCYLPSHKKPQSSQEPKWTNICRLSELVKDHRQKSLVFDTEIMGLCSIWVEIQRELILFYNSIKPLHYHSEANHNSKHQWHSTGAKHDITLFDGKTVSFHNYPQSHQPQQTRLIGWAQALFRNITSIAATLHTIAVLWEHGSI